MCVRQKGENVLGAIRQKGSSVTQYFHVLCLSIFTCFLLRSIAKLRLLYEQSVMPCKRKHFMHTWLFVSISLKHDFKGNLRHAIALERLVNYSTFHTCCALVVKRSLTHITAHDPFIKFTNFCSPFCKKRKSIKLL